MIGARLTVAMEIQHPRLALHTRRRSNHNRRPPPAPVRLLLQKGPTVTLLRSEQHDASAPDILAVTRRLAGRLFCGFDRWAAAVHRPLPPTTVPQAAKQLGSLRDPPTPLALTVQFNQVNAYSLGPGLTLVTAKLRKCELDDLRWLAHATQAWRPGVSLVRQGFVGNNVLRQAHADMVRRDGNQWGGLVPPGLAAMVRHGAEAANYYKR